MFNNVFDVLVKTFVVCYVCKCHCLRFSMLHLGVLRLIYKGCTLLLHVPYYPTALYVEWRVNHCCEDWVALVVWGLTCTTACVPWAVTPVLGHPITLRWRLAFFNHHVPHQPAIIPLPLITILFFCKYIFPVLHLYIIFLYYNITYYWLTFCSVNS